MEKDESETWLDRGVEAIDFLKDEKMVKEMIKELNEQRIFRINKISDILKCSNLDAYRTLNYLAKGVHDYLTHKETFDQDLKTAQVDTKIKNALISFIDNLDDKGRKLLNLKFLSDKSYREEGNLLVSSRDELFLKTIYGENEKPMGLLPLIKLSIEKEDENGERSYQDFILSLPSFKSIVDSFQNAYEQNDKLAKSYVDKLGDDIIIYDEK